jgi:hypothetical protein
MDRHSILIEELVSLIRYNQRRNITAEILGHITGSQENGCEIIFRKDNEYLYNIVLIERIYSLEQGIEFSGFGIARDIKELLNN